MAQVARPVDHLDWFADGSPIFDTYLGPLWLGLVERPQRRPYQFIEILRRGSFGMRYGLVFSSGLGLASRGVALYVYPYQRHDAHERSGSGAMGE